MTGYEIFGLACAVAAPLSVCGIALIGRLNGTDEDDPEDTIPIPPVDEPLGYMVDVSKVMDRYSED